MLWFIMPSLTLGSFYTVVAEDDGSFTVEYLIHQCQRCGHVPLCHDDIEY